MRLWTLHPKYLDARGLVALWREALLAQAVLKGLTSGYTRHPQLNRFRASAFPLESIASYLQAVYTEATNRGYCFDVTKITATSSVQSILVTRGQLDYEWAHLAIKLRVRAPSWLAKFASVSHPKTHPMFRVIPGPVAEWEVLSPTRRLV